MKHIFTSETENYFFKQQLLPPLIRGESTTIFWLPHGGQKTQTMFFIENATHFGLDKLDKYKIAYINPYEAVQNTPEEYFSLMLYNLDPKDYRTDENKSVFFQLKEKICQNLKMDNHLIFVLGGFDKIDLPVNFFNNLFALWCLEKSKIHFIFATTSNIISPDCLLKYGKLKEPIGQNLVYSPLLSPSDSEVAIEVLSEKYSYTLPKPIKKQIIEISGGYVGVIKECLRMYSTNSLMSANKLLEFASKYYGIQIIFEDLWESLTAHDKDVLLQIASGNYTNGFKISDFLLNLKIVSRQGSTYSLFSPLFSSFIKQQKRETRILSFDRSTGEILINKQPLKEKITLHEYHLLSVFLQNQNKIISRDEIAETLWGSQVDEKYSDWAIDQSIALLRKKLEKIGVAVEYLQTIKGRGYRWIESLI